MGLPLGRSHHVSSHGVPILCLYCDTILLSPQPDLFQYFRLSRFVPDTWPATSSHQQPPPVHVHILHRYHLALLSSLCNNTNTFSFILGPLHPWLLFQVFRSSLSDASLYARHTGVWRVPERTMPKSFVWCKY